jgi:hypothetical protein
MREDGIVVGQAIVCDFIVVDFGVWLPQRQNGLEAIGQIDGGGEVVDHAVRTIAKESVVSVRRLELLSVTQAIPRRIGHHRGIRYASGWEPCINEMARRKGPQLQLPAYTPACTSTD